MRPTRGIATRHAARLPGARRLRSSLALLLALAMLLSMAPGAIRAEHAVPNLPAPMPEGLAPQSTAPVIDVWYGDTQPFGHLGVPQYLINILGNVQPPELAYALTYTLNGGDPRDAIVHWTPTTPSGRLANPGDFNIEIPYAELTPGPNVVILSVEDGEGQSDEKTVTVQYTPDVVWPRRDTISWSGVDNLQDVVQIVDGMWAVDNGWVRPVAPDVRSYDRLLSFGDVTWVDYEITVPIVFRALYGSDGGAGILVRWQGHAIDDWRRPRYAHPLGALGWYRLVGAGQPPRLSIFGNGANIAEDTSGRTLAMNETYFLKMRSETQPGGLTLYSFKVWHEDDPEPATWDLTGDALDMDPRKVRGGAMLVAHRADVSFGEVTITPLGAGHQLTVDATEGGSVEVEPEYEVYLDGETATLTAVADPGWAFSGWQGDLSGTENPVVVTMDSDKEITALFEEEDVETYALTVQVVGEGTVARNPDRATFIAGEQATLTAVPAGGWTFGGWSGAASGTQNPITLTMDEDRTVTATFAQETVTYTLTVQTAGDGSGTVQRNPALERYPAGQEVTLIAAPSDGSVFAGWQGDASGTASQITVTMDRDKTVTALFAEKVETYVLTVAYAGDGSGQVQRDPEFDRYPAGEQVALSALPDLGSTFLGWEGAASGVNPRVTISIEGATHVIARFRLVPPPEPAHRLLLPLVVQRAPRP